VRVLPFRHAAGVLSRMQSDYVTPPHKSDHRSLPPAKIVRMSDGDDYFQRSMKIFFAMHIFVFAGSLVDRKYPDTLTST
jgi:hypothetical protein